MKQRNYICEYTKPYYYNIRQSIQTDCEWWSNIFRVAFDDTDEEYEDYAIDKTCQLENRMMMNQSICILIES